MQNAILSALLILACAAPQRAAEPNDLDLVRPDAKAFVTIRAAEVARKFDLEDWATKFPPLRALKDQWKGQLVDVLRVTQVRMDENDRGLGIFLVRTAKGCDRRKILDQFIPQGAEAILDGQTFHVSNKGDGNEHFAVLFHDDQSTIVGPSPEAIHTYLAKPKDVTAFKPGFQEILKAAHTEDFAAWCNLAGPAGHEQTHIAVGGVETASCQINFGDKTRVELTGYFADAERTEPGETFVKWYLKTARMYLLSISAAEDAGRLVADPSKKVDLWPGAGPFIETLERDLQAAKFERKDKTMTVSWAFSADPKSLKQQAEGIAATDIEVFSSFGMINRYADGKKTPEIVAAQAAPAIPQTSPATTPVPVTLSNLAAGANELDLVRPDAKSFVSVRVAELDKKFDVEAWAAKFPPLKDLKEKWKGPLSELTRVTQVHLGDNYCGCVHIFHTAKGCDRDKIIDHLVPEGKWIERNGGKYLVSAKGEAKEHFAVFFLDDERTIMSHSPEAIQKFLVKPQVEIAEKPGFREALKAAETKDVAAWRDAAGENLLEESDGKFGGLEAVAGSLEFGAKLQVEATGYFALPEQSKIGFTFARMYLKQARAMMLSMSFSGETNELMVRKDAKADLWPGAVGLLDALENDLRSARIETRGNAVTLSMALSADPKTIKTHAEGIAATDGSMFAGLGMIQRYESNEKASAKLADINRAMDAKSPPPSSTVPSPAEVKRLSAEQGFAPPQYFPADPSGVTRGALPPNVLPPMTQPVALPSSGVVPVSRTESGVPHQPVLPPTEVKFSVVNTRSEAAMIFELQQDNALKFKEKLAAGKVLDLRCSGGRQWIAVFPDNPSGESFTTGVQNVWLLRESGKPEPNTK